MTRLLDAGGVRKPSYQRCSMAKASASNCVTVVSGPLRGSSRRARRQWVTPRCQGLMFVIPARPAQAELTSVQITAICGAVDYVVQLP